MSQAPGIDVSAPGAGAAGEPGPVPHRLDRDRTYCRSVLPRVSRTFALNIRLLRGSMGNSVRVAYLLCRAADAIEDSWPGGSSELGARFDAFIGALEGRQAAAEALAREAAALGPGRADLDLLARLPAVLRVFESLGPDDRDAVADGVRTLALGMRRYAMRAAERTARGEERAYLDNEPELHDYCFVVAGCVGVMLTRLFGMRTRTAPEQEALRLELAPTVGEALQLTNILLDWPRDVRRGRCYVPAEWLAEYQLSPRELVDPSRAPVRPAAKRLESLARTALARVPDYLDTIPSRHVRYRLFCLWPALWALASLRHARRDPEFPWGPQRPRLPREEIRAVVIASALSGHSRSGVRRLFASLGSNS